MAKYTGKPRAPKGSHQRRHLSTEELLQLTDWLLGPAPRRFQHLGACAACRRRFTQVLFERVDHLAPGAPPGSNSSDQGDGP